MLLLIKRGTSGNAVLTGGHHFNFLPLTDGVSVTGISSSNTHQTNPCDACYLSSLGMGCVCVRVCVSVCWFVLKLLESTLTGNPGECACVFIYGWFICCVFHHSNVSPSFIGTHYGHRLIEHLPHTHTRTLSCEMGIFTNR